MMDDFDDMFDNAWSHFDSKKYDYAAYDHSDIYEGNKEYVRDISIKDMAEYRECNIDNSEYH